MHFKHESLLKSLWSEKCTLCYMINTHPLFPLVSSVQQLNLIKEHVQDLLVDQMKTRSESLIADLERMTARLKTEPEDVRDFSKYAFTVKKLYKITCIQQRGQHLNVILYI